MAKRNTAPRVGFVSLGCPKALVDSERILTQLRAEGYATAPAYAEADLVIVNTCGFIDAAAKHGFELIPLIWSFAYPSGVIRRADYDRLKQVSTQPGIRIYRYLSPDFKRSDFKTVMVDPIVLYQNPEKDLGKTGITEETTVTLRRVSP